MSELTSNSSGPVSLATEEQNQQNKPGYIYIFRHQNNYNITSLNSGSVHQMHFIIPTIKRIYQTVFIW
jgi:hypothetical protein